MKWMNGRSLALYAGVGYVVAGITWCGYQGCSDTADQARIHPAFAQFKKTRAEYDRWEAGWRQKYGPALLRKSFEEALAGKVPVERFESGSCSGSACEPIKKLLVYLRSQVLSTGRKPEQIARAAKDKFIDHYGQGDTDDIFRLRSGDLIHCQGGWNGVATCVPGEVIRVLAEPERLAALLNGDTSVIPAGLSPKEAWRPGPTYPEDAPQTVETPFWLLLRQWLYASIAFALVFFLVSLPARWLDGDLDLQDEPNEDWSPALDSLPDFVLGWLVFLSMAPGMLLAHLVNLATKDARPAALAVKRWLKPLPFEQEMARLTEKVEALKQAPSMKERREMAAKLEAAVENIRAKQNGEFLAKLEALVDEVNSRRAAEADLDAWLKEQTKG